MFRKVISNDRAEQSRVVFDYDTSKLSIFRKNENDLGTYKSV